MRSVSIALMLVVVAMASATPVGENAPKPHYNLSDAKVHFEKFIKDYNRAYKDEADKEEHYKAFVESLNKINQLNEANKSATYDINKFADYTEEERKSMRGLKRP